MRRNKFLLLAFLLLMATQWGCGSDLNSGGDQTQPRNAAEELFVGSLVCRTCHHEIYDTFINSGHPNILHKVKNDTVPSFPFSSINGALSLVNDEDGVTDNTLGTPGTYGDISYVIGGYGWKVLWTDADGFIITGSEVQFNLHDGSIAAYDDNEIDKPYNCGNCHTTGWQHFDTGLNNSRQDDLPGMDGTFVYSGIQCESCHGGGLHHVGSQQKKDIVRIAQARTTADFLADDMALGLAVACSECHTRDGEKSYPSYVSAAERAGYSDGGANEGGRIAVSDGLIRNNEQYDELLGLNPDNLAAGGTGAHLRNGVDCIVCHDPHTTTKYQSVSGDNPGVRTECNDCHKVKGFTVPTHGIFDCVVCHMPRMVKSAVNTNGWEGAPPAVFGAAFGDIRTHIFKIDLSKDPDTEQFSGAFAYPWITANFACGLCHSDPAAMIGLLPANGIHPNP